MKKCPEHLRYFVPLFKGGRFCPECEITRKYEKKIHQMKECGEKCKYCKREKKKELKREKLDKMLAEPIPPMNDRIADEIRKMT